MLELNNVKKILGKKEIIKGVDIVLHEGVIGLLGANGAGKTTLIRCLTGIYDLDEGNITYNGEDIRKSKMYHRQIGYLPQLFGMFKELTVYEMLDYFCVLKKIPKNQRGNIIDNCLQKVNLTDKSSTRVGKLSGGMIRRVGIAQSILGDPTIIVLDEPTAGLDPQERMRFKNILAHLKTEGRLILLSTHIVEDIDSVCDGVVVLHEGQIVYSGSCAGLAEKAKGKVYLVPMHQLSHIRGKFCEGRIEGNTCRVICAEEQTYDQVEPTIEDGYMAVMHGWKS